MIGRVWRIPDLGRHNARVKIRGALLVLLLAVAGLGACSSSGGHPKTASSSAATPQQRFVTLLRTDTRAKSIVIDDSDEDLVSEGRTVCEILAHPDQQNWSSNPLDDLVHSGDDMAHAAAIVWAAKRELCPQPNGGASG